MTSWGFCLHWVLVSLHCQLFSVVFSLDYMLCMQTAGVCVPGGEAFLAIAIPPLSLFVLVMYITIIRGNIKAVGGCVQLNQGEICSMQLQQDPCHNTSCIRDIYQGRLYFTRVRFVPCNCNRTCSQSEICNRTCSRNNVPTLVVIVHSFRLMMGKHLSGCAILFIYEVFQHHINDNNK